jgi:uncharacterized membrane protein YraQ (UPF0718 family)
MAPWLLLGLLLAGVLHVAIPRGVLYRHLGRKGLRSVLRATLIGIPLPLCSCGVIPASIGLRREGASQGASVGFLISTPQTGVDSILVSASFLGWPFAIFKVASALVTGLLGGLMADAVGEPELETGTCCCKGGGDEENPRARPLELLHFGFVRLLGEIYLWVIVGALVAGIISALVSPARFASIPWIGGPVGMLLTLFIALPMYVCSSASVPIAASLVYAGFPPGAALVFLMAGPATNVATVGAVFRTFGARLTAIYVGTVAVASIVLGMIFDFIIGPQTDASRELCCLAGAVPRPLAVASAVLLLALAAGHALADIRRRTRSG